MAHKFHERFKLDINLDEARRRFVNRANNELISTLGMLENVSGDGEGVERFICSKLGERWKGWGCLSTIIGDDFFVHVQALEALYAHPASMPQAVVSIHQIMADTEIDIGLRWENGSFLPSGSPLLDAKLVNDVLGCLKENQYGGVATPFRKGLEHLLQSISKTQFLSDVVTDMYEALEALAKIVTGRGDKDLSANMESFIKAVQVSDTYKPILKEYIAYGNKIRHAGRDGQPKPDLTRKEVESFVYLTGVFIRLAVIEEAQA
jgi:hypothetical protein